MTMFLAAQDDDAEIAVGRFPVIVGRHPLCDVWLDSIRVSRRHCTLVEIEGAILVRDLGSTNGVRINGRRAQSGWLRPGDEFWVAHIRFRVFDDTARPGPRHDASDQSKARTLPSPPRD